MKKVLLVFGTRPEAIKMAPLVIASKDYSNLFDLKVCVTAQHRQMLDQVLTFFNIKIDYDLDLMKPNQTLFELTSNCLEGLEKVIDSYRPDFVFVQGDTTTAFVGALAAFYKKIPVAHVEAGLRSGCRYSPFPEEMNRVLIDHITDYHFAPTDRAVRNLQEEGLNNNIWLVGNTIVDALLLGLEIIKSHDETVYKRHFHFIDFSKRVILVTGHRRESFGTPFENICYALQELIHIYDDIEIVYPVHLNPNVRGPVYRILGHQERIHLIDPLCISIFNMAHGSVVYGFNRFRRNPRRSSHIRETDSRHERGN